MSPRKPSLTFPLFVIVAVAAVAVAAVKLVGSQSDFHLQGADSPAATAGCLLDITDEDRLCDTWLLDVVTADGTAEKMLHYTGMLVSYNPLGHLPNWVAWELTGEETAGSFGRSDRFTKDPDVPSCPSSDDYLHSGYDRGHMAPAGDMKWSARAMEESFYMTNIAPQVHALNSGSWKNLEEKCRIWARHDSAIVIVCGPVYRQDPIEYISDLRIAVPAEYFKVIIAPYSSPPRGIGFIMPNAKVPGGMQACAMSIDEVERITGHDFFHNLPDDLEAAIESQNNFHQWSTIR